MRVAASRSGLVRCRNQPEYEAGMFHELHNLGRVVGMEPVGKERGTTVVG
ncbi:hypothetical protein HanIR_Chr06g0283411 [Helianthus annuus]|nr:hypothetical protein HanIR_Chr06g0283411 [Helianthus annuus]